MREVQGSTLTWVTSPLFWVDSVVTDGRKEGRKSKHHYIFRRSLRSLVRYNETQTTVIRKTNRQPDKVAYYVSYYIVDNNKKSLSCFTGHFGRSVKQWIMWKYRQNKSHFTKQCKITFSRLPRFTTDWLTLFHSVSSKSVTLLARDFCCLGSLSFKIATAIFKSLKCTAAIQWNQYSINDTGQNCHAIHSTSFTCNQKMCLWLLHLYLLVCKIPSAEDDRCWYCFNKVSHIM